MYIINLMISWAKSIKRKIRKMYYGSYWKKKRVIHQMELAFQESCSKRTLNKNGRTVKIVQIVGSLNYGDAVGNDVMAIKKALSEDGYMTAIFASAIDKRVSDELVFYLEQLPRLDEKDIVIYHFGSADRSYEIIRDLKCKKILRYHNVTPPDFFANYDKYSEKNTRNGLKQIRDMKDFFDYGMVDSEFNKMDLIKMGHTYPIDVVPILIPFVDYKKPPTKEVVEKYRKDGYINIIFVGRIVPNKKDEDIIRCFQEYKKNYNEKSRLILVGNYAGQEKYYNELQEIIKKDSMDDVVMTGHISFADLLAYYTVADLFLCLSEHEGFCVPLIEAMLFGVPIIAYKKAAVPETLGKGGLLLESKEPKVVAKAMDDLLSNKDMREIYQKNAKNIIEQLQYETVKKQIIMCMDKVIGL